jgi:hypothetical protein
MQNHECAFPLSVRRLGAAGGNPSGAELGHYSLLGAWLVGRVFGELIASADLREGASLQAR